MRLAELVATFAVATDAGMGFPMDHGLRNAAVAARLGEIASASEVERADAYYLAYMRYIGCTGDSDLATEVMGDEVHVRGQMYGADWAAPAEVMPKIMRAIGGGRGVRGAVSAVVGVARMPRLFNTARAHCEVAVQLAAALGFGDAFRRALFQSYERWDGKGFPSKLRGDATTYAMRIAQAAEEVEFGHRGGGADAAAAHVGKRTGKTVDPTLAKLVREHLAEVCAPLDAPSPWTAAMDAEPGPRRIADDAQIDAALTAMADFADLKSRFTRGHARAVAHLARRAALQLGLPAATATALERAGLLHDLGRVVVSAGVWDKPGPLTDAEWERVRMHTYMGERILARASGLAAVNELATLAHERLDASGYHRKLGASACTAPARVLAAADVYCALTEDRAHRPAYSGARAAALLGDMGTAGTLCPDAVRAVLAATGQAAPPRAPLPANLSEREAEVLRAVARGLTNKEVATALDISAKTVSRHLESIFKKIGVTTRAAATMYAMQKGLLDRMGQGMG